MAKKTKVVDKCCAPVDANYKPRLYLDLQDTQVGVIKGLTIGEEVELMVKGKVVGLTQRERPDYDDSKKTVKTGSIDLEGYEVHVMGEESNEFKKMADED